MYGLKVGQLQEGEGFLSGSNSPAASSNDLAIAQPRLSRGPQFQEQLSTNQQLLQSASTIHLLVKALIHEGVELGRSPKIPLKLKIVSFGVFKSDARPHFPTFEPVERLIEDFT